MSARAPSSLFAGVPQAEVDVFLGRLERRRFPAGSVVIAEGDLLRELYVVEAGSADVLVTDRHGAAHRVAHTGAGATLGEMSLFTGRPATATVRATSDLDALVVEEEEFERLAERFPVVYRNLGATLSERLARASRLAVHEQTARLAVLGDLGAPPLLGYALACSVAWHSRATTLLVVLDPDPPEELRRLATTTLDAAGTAPGQAPRRAELAVASPDGAFAPESVRSTLEDLFLRYEFVLLQTRAELPPLATARELSLGPPGVGPQAGELALRGWLPAPPRPGPGPGATVAVPEPTPQDERGLAEGLLSPASDAGRALGWVARDLADLEVGLALGAGSLRGYAHVGVLRTLERAGIRPDYVAGTSVGAAVAALYALGHTPDEIADVLDGCGATMFRPTLPLASLLSSRGVRAFIRGVGAGRRIEDLDLPLAIVAADIMTREEVVLREGDVAEAVVASISIPGIYPVQQIGRHALVDGGVLNPVPASVAAEMGAGRVIAVKLGSPGERAAAAAEDPSGARPLIVGVLLRAIEMMQERIETETTAPTVFVLPKFEELPGAKLRRFREGRRYVEAGAAAAEEALPRIAAMLPWVRA